MPKLKSKSKATIIATGDGNFALVDGDQIIRSGFRTRALAGMWGARQGLYQRKTPRRPKQEIPADLADERILKLPLAAKITGRGYPRFLIEARAGMWGELYQLGKNIFGVKLGNVKRGLAAAQLK